MADFLEAAWQKYRKVVVENPETVGQLEATSRILSYIIAGRLEDSQVLSELVYLASNLLVFSNDQILKGAAKLIPSLSLSEERIQKFLTVLQYAEVFLEMAASKSWGETGRWILIVCVQITKTVLRLLLLWKHKTGIQTCPPLLPLDRDALIQKQLKTSTVKELNEFEENLEVESEGAKHTTFKLKRSGRTMRKLSAAPPMNFRSWKVPNEHPQVDDTVSRRLANYQSTNMSPQRMWAESLYITRPLFHLLGLKVCGLDSWKPWLLSGGIDVASMYMIGDTEDLNPREKTEMKKRTLMLLFYILRSPFYDQYSKKKILFILTLLADNVPLIGLLIRPLVQYLPYWQRVYFYLWTS